MADSRPPNQFDAYTGRPYTEWPRILQAIAIVICLNDHDPTLENEFIQHEIERLGLMEMSDAEIEKFRGRHLLHHMN